MDSEVEGVARPSIENRGALRGSSITSLGGGHGLFQTLRADRQCYPQHITAIVTVADDGGSSGRIRRELGMIPPGDLRMALAALAADDAEGELWAETLQHRFGGHGALAGHAVGNLVICGLAEVLGSMQEALNRVSQLTRSPGHVVPMCTEPLDIEADVAGLHEDPRVIRTVRGQVAVASTPGQVRRVRLIPEHPSANPAALSAIREADLVTLGPGSWFSSVIPHLMVPEIVTALNETHALKVVVLNLSAEPGETQGFSMERHVHMLSQQAPDLRVDYVVVDAASLPSDSEREYVRRAAKNLGACVLFREVRTEGDAGSAAALHDPCRLAEVFEELVACHLREDTAQ